MTHDRDRIARGPGPRRGGLLCRARRWPVSYAGTASPAGSSTRAMARPRSTSRGPWASRPRTMEVFRETGIADAVLARAKRFHGLSAFSAGWRILPTSRSTSRAPGYPPPPRLRPASVGHRAAPDPPPRGLGRGSRGLDEPDGLLADHTPGCDGHPSPTAWGGRARSGRDGSEGATK